jgi:hypothetical protein
MRRSFWLSITVSDVLGVFSHGWRWGLQRRIVLHDSALGLFHSGALGVFGRPPMAAHTFWTRNIAMATSKKDLMKLLKG